MLAVSESPSVREISGSEDAWQGDGGSRKGTAGTLNS